MQALLAVPNNKVPLYIYQMAKNTKKNGEKAAQLALAGKAIKEARVTLSLTQPGLATAMGVSTAAFQQWEYGHTKPGTEYWSKLGDLLQIDVGALYGAPQKTRGEMSAKKARAAAALVETIEANLRALKVMLQLAATDQRLEDMGIKAAPKHKKKEHA